MSSAKKKVQIDPNAQDDGKGAPAKRVVKSVVPKLQNNLLGLTPLRTLAVRELKDILGQVMDCTLIVIYRCQGKRQW
jgi:hypothetical protein